MDLDCIKIKSATRIGSRLSRYAVHESQRFLLTQRGVDFFYTGRSLTKPQYFYVAQLLYKFAAAFTKVSLLFLYLRIFTNRKFRIAAWTTMAVVVAYSSGSIVATIWQCR